MKNKKVVIAGGTGFIGRHLANYFANDNEVVILTRKTKGSANNAFEDFEVKNSKLNNVRLVKWNGKDDADWSGELDGADLVINLAGKSVNCRYTEKNKKEIFESRVDSTTAIGSAISKATNPPKLWINAASATIYRNATDRPQDEFTGEMHNDFSVQVCKLWENTFFNQTTPSTRKVALRMAITLGAGGVMVPYFNLVKFGLGGRQGNGTQMFSWIHIEDVCRCVDFIFNNPTLEGVFNLSAPNPVTNNTFMATLRKVTGQKLAIPACAWMLKIGAAVIGTETELILKSRWVLPTRLLNEGFKFTYPTLEGAFRNIVGQLPREKYRLY